MKLKKTMAGLLTIVLSLSMMTACANTQKESETSQSSEAETVKLRKLYVRAPQSVTEMTATFLNTSNGKTADVKMTKNSEDDIIAVFSCEADVNQYNMVHVTNEETQSMDVAFNSFISGWNLSGDELLPYVTGSEPSYDPKFETKVFQFDGYDKTVYIWTPDDYDEQAEEKYSVIYMFDGQSILTTGKENGMDNDLVCWNVSEHIASMMAQTENKAIIVATDNNDVYRDDELVPNLGDINMDDVPGNINPDDISLKRGSDFADFICDTVMPYINENYNVYTDARHTALAGASLGGLETFYMVLTHPDKFGTGGVMSATFDMFNDKEWENFLSDKMDMENAPFLYFYAGRYMGDNGDVTESMYNKMVESGYPKDKLVFSKYEQGEHLIEYWRNIYPEFLEAVFTQNVSALEFGVPVHYVDTSDPYEEYLKEMELDESGVEPGYVYYDNSETKWEEVYCYWWGGYPVNSITKELYYNDWPGYRMEQVDETDIYRIVAPLGVTGIIFDSGVTDREVAEGKDAYQTVDLTYSSEMIGKVYKIDVTVEPKADPGLMKTKRRYSDGSWSDYSAEE